MTAQQPTLGHGAPASSDEVHEMSDGDDLARWTICGRCHTVRGGPIGTVDGVTVWQRCACVPAEGLPAQPRMGDFNTELELCRACGLVLLQSGSRWSVWFCGPCATQAKSLNDRVGRCVVPIGRHSLMNCVTVRSAAPEDIRSFAGELSTLFGATGAVEQWSRSVVRENLVAAGRPQDVDVDVASYLAWVRGVASSDQRFAEMVAALGGASVAGG
jgi:hypothetical protein